MGKQDPLGPSLASSHFDALFPLPPDSNNNFNNTMFCREFRFEYFIYIRTQLFSLVQTQYAPRYSRTDTIAVDSRVYTQQMSLLLSQNKMLPRTVKKFTESRFVITRSVQRLYTRYTLLKPQAFVHAMYQSDVQVINIEPL